jgi:tetratricopeptide (TPR) repeat protein
MAEPSDDPIQRRIHRLAAVQLISVAILLMVVAIITILQTGTIRDLSNRLASLEQRCSRLEPPPPERDAPANGSLSEEPITGHTGNSADERKERLADLHAALLSTSRRLLQNGKLDPEITSILLDELLDLQPDPAEFEPQAAGAAARIFLLAGFPEAGVRWGTCAMEAARSVSTALTLAMAHDRVGNKGRALQYAIEATSGGGAPPEAYLLRGRLELESGLLEEGEATLREALDNDEITSDAAVLLTGYFLEQGDDASARETLSRGLEATPERRELLRFQAMLHLIQGDYTDCIRLCASLLESKPADAGIVKTHGEALLARGDLKAAVATFERLVELEPDRAAGYELLGLALLAQVQPERAAKAFARATELDPTAAVTWHRLGVALANSNDCEGALKALDRSLELEEDQAEVHFARAVCFARLNNETEAEKALVRALALDDGLVEKAQAAGIFDDLLAEREAEQGNEAEE